MNTALETTANLSGDHTIMWRYKQEKKKLKWNIPSLNDGLQAERQPQLLQKKERKTIPVENDHINKLTTKKYVKFKKFLEYKRMMNEKVVIVKNISLWFNSWEKIIFLHRLLSSEQQSPLPLMVVGSWNTINSYYFSKIGIMKNNKI